MPDYRIVPDETYGFLRVEPLPTEAELSEYYKTQFYSPAYPGFNDSSLEVQQQEKAFQDSRWEAICRVVEKHFGHLSGLSAFDIGCGFGLALLHLREKGMIAVGQDSSPEAVEYCRSQGLFVYADCAPLRNSLDLVLLINVLEHLPNPAATLHNIAQRLLRPGGLLVIDVPNDFNVFQLEAQKKLGLPQWWFCPPNHLNYFSATSLNYLLKKCGYEVVHCEATFPMELFLLLGDDYISTPSLGPACHQRRCEFEQSFSPAFLSQLYQSLAKLDLGRQVVSYATLKGAS